MDSKKNWIKGAIKKPGALTTTAKRAGADTFVAGSSVFNAPDPGEMVALLRNAASIN